MGKDNILVLGGGIAGLTSALELAESGNQVFLVDKEAEVGGYAAQYCCKGLELCQKCGACFVAQAVDQVNNHPKVSIFCGLQIKSSQSTGDGFKVTFVNDRGEESSFDANAVVVATGFTPFDATKLLAYGYKVYQGIYTAYDLEQMIREKGSFKNAFPAEIEKIAFVQCVGSRSNYPQQDYCCRVGCMYTVRLARLIREELPEVALDIFYMDLQNFGKGFMEYKNECITDLNINLILGRPAKSYYHPLKKKVLLQHESTVDGEIYEHEYDMVFLAIGSQPGVDTQNIANIFNIDLNEDSFFNCENSFNPGATSQKGIFAAGACTGPRDIAASMQHAKAVSLNVIDYLKK
ncbi:MAG: CoB--CoM heterodisulfide reductase iron-sulfur subunit A family protein [Candidatus Syntrophonatronum acetioxidans]|uniref:CoB--CoM heterodisulfide reductase iron-sulfur subunit A family protein n=1 Tax=Candidatus Syntrophonatronum acetioxidans TaxID=1795816 RepID=A0A424YIR5_9FIRM|nr:MAG: CoB--CoM heterodisulfide reductase iron-sulfur subunit A family protein [Candidatus Syntrophonatronum acetioxidans]